MKVFVRLLVCFMLILGVFGSSQAMGQLFMFENPLVGEKAPDFSLKTVEGKDVNLNQLRQGQNTIVFFWATWCPHCREQLDLLSGAPGEEIEKKGTKIVLVDIGEPAAEVSSYIKKNNVRFDVLLDEQEKVSEQYHLIGVPTFVFINKDGIVQAVEHAIPEKYEEKFAPEKP
jgi:peroxiredoxin